MRAKPNNYFHVRVYTDDGSKIEVGRTESRKVTKPDLPVFRDEAVAIPEGEVRYTVDLDEATVESLANGVCPEDLAERMWKNLSWRREASRHHASERVETRRQRRR